MNNILDHIKWAHEFLRVRDAEGAEWPWPTNIRWKQSLFWGEAACSQRPSSNAAGSDLDGWASYTPLTEVDFGSVWVSVCCEETFSHTSLPLRGSCPTRTHAQQTIPHSHMSRPTKLTFLSLWSFGQTLSELISCCVPTLPSLLKRA